MPLVAKQVYSARSSKLRFWITSLALVTLSRGSREMRGSEMLRGSSFLNQVTSGTGTPKALQERVRGSPSTWFFEISDTSMVTLVWTTMVALSPPSTTAQV
uniref:Putative secreted protein n=1 Tax=Ixodes ricinus TaxID=34613 RepID=A0A6B0U693_IXORI